MKKNLIVFLFFLGLAGCNRSSPNEPNEAAELEKQRQTKQKVQDLCSRHNAVADWKESRPRYSVEMEEGLVRTDGHPVLIFASVEDIERESEKYTVYLREGVQLSDFFGESKRYAVIAKISEVKKVKFELKSRAANPEEVYIELEPSNVFIAKGSCLDLLFIGDPFIPSEPTEADLADFDFIRGLGFDIYFILDCTSEQAREIMSRSADSN